MSQQAADRRDRLEALRSTFQDRLAGASDRDATAMGRLIKDIDADLASLPSATEVSAADEVARRRAERRAGSASPTRATRSG